MTRLEMPALTTVTGDVLVESSLIEQVIAPRLQTIGGGLNLRNFTSPMALREFQADLTRVDGGSWIRGTQLPNLQVFRQMTALASLILQENAAMTDLSGMEQVTDIPGIVILWSNPLVTDLQAFAGVRSINTLAIGFNDRLTSLTGPTT